MTPSNYSWIDERVATLGFWRSDNQPWCAPTPGDFERIETAIGASLPEDYRYFVGLYGGGMFLHEDFSIEASINEPCPWGDSVSPEGLYSPCKGRDSIEEALLTYRGRIPAGVIPIAPDAGGNEVCLDVAGEFPGSVWFWDHEQRWFTRNLQETAEELDAAGLDTRRFSVHDIIREWARRHADRFDRPPDYMGMYRIAPSFADFLRALHQVPYE